ncbi:MAG: hypothetical protein JXA66_02385 [Oligoflexia bacterium]|nr:hypothetical protein [Oligoflexia bacterium]
MKYFLFVVSCLFIMSVKAEAVEFTGSGSLEVSNNYYFRGDYLFNEGTASLFPSVTVGTVDPAVSLNVWAAVPVSKRSVGLTAANKDEIDVTLSAAFEPMEKLSVSAGFILYTLPAADPFFHTEEIFGAASYGIGAGLSAGTGVYIDLDSLKGIYWTLGPSYTMPLMEKLDFNSAIMLSFSKYSGTDFAFIETGFSAGLAYNILENASLSAGTLYNYNIDLSKHLYAVKLAFSYSI